MKQTKQNPRKKGGSVAIDTVTLPEKPLGKRAARKGSVAIDTVPLPERNARLAREMLTVERQLGRLVAQSRNKSELLEAVALTRACRFRPHYRHGMTPGEGAQATCDAIEAFLDCLAGKSARPE
jgi:hypothetical protein